MKSNAFKPMLASPVTDYSKLKFPKLASPKVDGIRAIMLFGQLVSRNLKPIPNLALRKALECPELEGLDGELIYGDPTAPDCLKQTNSHVMTVNGTADGIVFYVFDYLTGPYAPFEERFEALQCCVSANYRARPVLGLDHVLVNTRQELEQLETNLLAKGFEGVMLRDPEARYKFGRSTEKEQGLLKVKRFVDAEAEVIGMYEENENTNQLELDLLGNAKRSTKKSGKVGKGTLGGFWCRDLKTGVEFPLGIGFSAQQRKDWWLDDIAMLPGKIVTYRHFPVGDTKTPRHGVFHAFRHENDMS